MKKLERSLGLKEILMVGFSTMLGTGIFVTPGIMYMATGPSLFLAYILGAILVIPSAMSMSELATAMPTSGGIYVYTDRTFGPFWGTFVGLGLWLSLLFKTAYALKGFGIYLEIFSDAPAIYTTLSALILMTILNIGGVSKMAKIISLIVLLCLATVGFTFVSSFKILSVDNAVPFFTNGIDGFLVSLTLGVGTFAGLTKLTAIAEEVKDPEKNLSKGILLSLLGVSFIYFLSAFIFSTALSHEASYENFKPLYTVVELTSHKFVAYAIAIIAVLTLASMANAGILASSRFPFAMSRDYLLPKFLGKLHNKFLTPLPSILLSSLIIALIMIFLDVAKVAKLSSVFIIMMFILVNLTVITLRESGTRWYKPRYKSPFYPLNHFVGILSGIILLFYMGELTILSLLLILVPSFLIYFIYGKNTKRKGVMGIHGPRLDIKTDAKEFQTNSLLFEPDKNATVIVPILGGETSLELLTEIGIILAEDGITEVVHISEIPEQAEFEDIEEPLGLKSLRRRVQVIASEKNSKIIFDSLATHDLTKTLYEMGKRHYSEWLLLGYQRKKRGQITVNKPTQWIKGNLNCHIGTFSDKGIRYFKKILVVLKGNDSDFLVLKTSETLANAFQATNTVLRDPSASIDSDFKEKRRIAVEKFIVNTKGRSRTHELIYDEHFDTLIQLSTEYDLIILAHDEITGAKRFFENRDDRLLSRAHCSVFSISEQH